MLIPIHKMRLMQLLGKFRLCDLSEIDYEAPMTVVLYSVFFCARNLKNHGRNKFSFCLHEGYNISPLLIVKF